MRSPSTPASRRRSFVLVCVLVGACLFVASPASARRGQDPVTTTAFSLDTTTPPSTTAATTTADTGTTSSTRRATREADTSQIDSENRRFTLVIVGLLVVAALLALLTIRYWRVTKPGRKPKDKKRPEPAAIDDYGDDDLFISTSGGDEDPGDEDIDDFDYEDDIDEARPRERRWGRRSRRAVAGADHADADDDWEPMATGEQERVSGQVPRATSRPSASQRAQALGATDRDT